MSPSPSPQRSKKSAQKSKKGAETSARRIAQSPRTMAGLDDDDPLLAGGLRDLGFGRCGGRLMGSRLEQTLCNLLSKASLTHSHSPRHFEVPVKDAEVAAYAPLVVLRGRGRGGKTFVLECMEEVDGGFLEKIIAFRQKFGAEFYVIFVAPEETLDLISPAAYDESAVTTDLGTLINRLAD